MVRGTLRNPSCTQHMQLSLQKQSRPVSLIKPASAAMSIVGCVHWRGARWAARLSGLGLRGRRIFGSSLVVSLPSGPKSSENFRRRGQMDLGGQIRPRINSGTVWSARGWSVVRTPTLRIIARVDEIQSSGCKTANAPAKKKADSLLRDTSRCLVDKVIQRALLYRLP
jgi:hypothetical protein